MAEAQEGWGWPLNSRKAHYFVGWWSLCRKWAYSGELDDDRIGSVPPTDPCAECRKRQLLLAGQRLKVALDKAREGRAEG